jgi:hypothetical protein
MQAVTAFLLFASARFIPPLHSIRSRCDEIATPQPQWNPTCRILDAFF